MDNHLATGKRAEKMACRFLQQQGLVLLQQNFQCRTGELDLVMQDNTSLVFVEVRFRKNSIFGTAAETVDRNKQLRLIRTAQHYLAVHRSQTAECRFDIVGVKPDGNKLAFEWIRDAFQLQAGSPF